MRCTSTVLLTMILACSTLEAQRRHQGFWIAFAPGGVGSADVEGFAYPLYLRLGGTTSQRLLLGVEWYGVILDAQPSAGMTNLTAIALLYPSQRGGFFAKGGLGIGRAESTCPDSPTDVASGLGTTLGVGIDLRLGRNVYLTPNVDMLWQRAERVLCPVPGQPQAGTVRGYSPGFFFTLGITWH